MSVIILQNERMIGITFDPDLPSPQLNYPFAPGNEDLIDVIIEDINVFTTPTEAEIGNITYMGKQYEWLPYGDAKNFTLSMINNKEEIILDQYPIASLIQRSAPQTGSINYKLNDDRKFDLRNINLTKSYITCVNPTSVQVVAPFVILFNFFYREK